MFIIEPVLLALMILGLIVPSLFSLINEEIGARQKGPKGRVAATLALLGLFPHRALMHAVADVLPRKQKADI